LVYGLLFAVRPPRLAQGDEDGAARDDALGVERLA
jgi:hypothetical protein